MLIKSMERYQIGAYLPYQLGVDAAAARCQAIMYHLFSMRQISRASGGFPLTDVFHRSPQQRHV